MKKILALVLALVLCLGLVACGESGKTDSTTKPTTAATTADGVQELKTEQDVVDKFGSPRNGKYKLANDITVKLKDDGAPLVVFATIELDLNGYTLTIEQPAVGNCVSIQGADGCTMTVKDTSAAGTGVLKGLITKEEMGRDLIRVNNNSQHFILESGTLEYAAAEGITKVGASAGIRVFNVTKNASNPNSAIVTGGKVVCNLPGAKIYCTGNAPIVVEGGSFTVNPSAVLAEGKTVTEETIDNVTWYHVK